MSSDLAAARGALLARECRATDLLAESFAASNAPANQHTFLRRFTEQAQATALAVDRMLDTGAPLPLLAGLAVSIKDLFDVAGHQATGGSVVLSDRPAASQDSAAVGRLRQAGAALIGHTNMTEFAFSGVGWNPHFGTPANVGTLAVDAATPRIPGGSTSGGATSVATGAAWAALGSDTGGSIRIPAALQGLVGFKNTARLTPASGCIPLSTTLDTVCAITRSVRDAITLHEVLAARRVRLAGRPLDGCHLALLRTTMLDDLDSTVGKSFEAAVATLRQQGAHIVEVILPSTEELSRIQATGGFSAAESWAWHRHLLAHHGDRYDPRVAQRIRRGASMSAADYIDLLQARADWIARMEAALCRFDAVLSPTVPIVAPPTASIADSDTEFFRVNTLLLRNTSVVNMLDGCALSLPCHAPDQLPVGLMVWSTAMRDDVVLDISLAIEAALARREH